MDFRLEKAEKTFRMGKGSEAAYELVRNLVHKIDEDIKNGELVKRVEEVVGILE